MAPQLRSKLLWDAHLAQFDALQSAYYEALQHDAAALRESFGCDRLNITLWLADARGGVARWVAQDRLHRALDDVRRVASGHDSEWFAGRALARETLMLHDVPDAAMSRWRAVFAVPLNVELAGLPSLTVGVLSIGLPDAAGHYDAPDDWSDAVQVMAEDWSTRLSDVLA
jgi:hypothetical protein